MTIRKRVWRFAFISAFLLALGALGAWLYTLFASPVSLQEEVVKVQIAESGPHGRAALARYPKLTPKLFALYGNEPGFRTMLDRFGSTQTFRIIGSCLNGGDWVFNEEATLEAGAASLLKGELPRQAELSAKACGEKMIEKINAEGNLFLAQFDIVQGHAYRLPLTTAELALLESFTKGFQDVERGIMPGGHVTAGDIGELALDTVGIYGVGKLAFLAKDGLDYAAARAGLFDAAKAVAPKVAKYGAAASFTYLAVAHPMVLVGWGNWLARHTIISPLWGQALVWFLPLTVLALVVNVVWFWTRPLFVLCSRGGRLAGRCLYLAYDSFFTY